MLIDAVGVASSLDGIHILIATVQAEHQSPPYTALI